MLFDVSAAYPPKYVLMASKLSHTQQYFILWSIQLSVRYERFSNWRIYSGKKHSDEWFMPLCYRDLAEEQRAEKSPESFFPSCWRQKGSVHLLLVVYAKTSRPQYILFWKSGFWSSLCSCPYIPLHGLRLSIRGRCVAIDVPCIRWSQFTLSSLIQLWWTVRDCHCIGAFADWSALWWLKNILEEKDILWQHSV